MIYRVKHENHYTTIRNKTVRDSRLSFKATGLLAYLLSLPDDTRFTREDLAKVKTDGEKAVRSALAELTRAGYLQREVVSEGRGKLRTVTTLRERSDSANELGEVTSGLLSPGRLSPSTKRPTIRRNKEGAPAARRPPPPEDLCLVCGVHAAYWYTRGGKGFCDEHRAEYALQRMEEER